MNHKYKLAVIIPTYNAEKTIASTVAAIRESLLRIDAPTQIIVVDDGSTDATATIVDALPMQVGKVDLMVIHKANGKCYRARLAGFKAMDAEYFGIVDADDSVVPEKFPRVLSVIEETKADVVECGWKVMDDGRVFSRSELHLNTPEEVMAGYIRPTLFGTGLAAYVWNKIYRNQYDFSTWIDGSFGGYDDLIHNLQFFQKVRSYVRIPDPLNLYAPNDGSITRSYNQDMLDRFVETANAKHKLMQCYECPDVEALFARWVRHEFRTALYMVAVVGRATMVERKANIVLVCRHPLSPYHWLGCLPSGMIVGGIRMLAKIRHAFLGRH